MGKYKYWYETGLTAPQQYDTSCNLHTREWARAEYPFAELPELKRQCQSAARILSAVCHLCFLSLKRQEMHRNRQHTQPCPNQVNATQKINGPLTLSPWFTSPFLTRLRAYQRSQLVSKHQKKAFENNPSRCFSEKLASMQCRRSSPWNTTLCLAPIRTTHPFWGSNAHAHVVLYRI